MTSYIATEFVCFDTNEHILTMRLNRPSHKNAFLGEMYLSLESALHHADTDPNVHVVILQGNEQDYTAGNDLSDFNTESMDGINTPAFRFLRALAAFKKPIIAAVRGVAIGIGTTSLLHVDFAFAHPNTRFQMPFVNLGLTPEGGATHILPQLSGMLAAKKMLMLGEPFNAEDALNYRIITTISETPEATALQTAQQLCKRPQQSLILTKQLLRNSAHTIDVINAEAEVFVQRVASDDCKNAVMQFMQRKKG